jgi:hypothetical protein
MVPAVALGILVPVPARLSRSWHLSKQEGPLGVARAFGADLGMSAAVTGESAGPMTSAIAAARMASVLMTSSVAR